MSRHCRPHRSSSPKVPPSYALHQPIEALAAQVQGYVARRFTSGAADVITRPFACECDDPDCDELLEIPVAEWESRAARAPVVAAR